MDTVKVKLYRDLRDEEKRLGAEAGGIKERANALEKELLEEFGEEGVQSVQVDGSTVYLKRELWAAKASDDVDSERIRQALHDAGLSEFVTEKHNSSTLSAYLRNLEDALDDGQSLTDAMPQQLRGVIKGVEVFKVLYRKAAAPSKPRKTTRTLTTTQETTRG